MRFRSPRRRALRRFHALSETFESRTLLAAVIAEIDDFRVPRSSWQFNSLDALRNNSDFFVNGSVQSIPGAIRVQVNGATGFAGFVQSLSHGGTAQDTLNFGAVFPSQISAAYQPHVTALLLEITSGAGTIEVKLNNGQGTAVFQQDLTISTGTLRVPLPTLGEVGQIVLTAKDNSSNFTLDRMSLELDTPEMGSLEQAVWRYAALLDNYDSGTGLVRDKGRDNPDQLDSPHMTAGLALATAIMVSRGVVPLSAGRALVTAITNKVTSLTDATGRGLLPQYVQSGAPAGRYSTVDTTIGGLSLILANHLLGQSTASSTALIQGIQWSTLIDANGLISHGVTLQGATLPTRWDVFGSESFLVHWAYASANPTLPLPSLDPRYRLAPTWDEAYFNSEMAALFFPMNGFDRFGNNWIEYRSAAAARQVAEPDPFGLLSPVEAVDHWRYPNHEYQVLGLGGHNGVKVDGTADTGHRHAAPHGLGLVASHDLSFSLNGWNFLKFRQAISPLNVVESAYYENNQLAENHLHSSLNLWFEVMGWARARRNGPFEPHVAALGNTFVRTGYNRLINSFGPVAADVVTWEAATERFRFAALNGTPRLADTAFLQLDPELVWTHTAQGDFDGDGRLDVAALTSTQLWHVGLSSDDYGFTRVWGNWIGVVGGNITHLLPGDYNGDGLADIAVRDATGKWFVAESTGQSFVTQTYGNWGPAGWKTFVAGRFNNDHRMDIAGFRADTGRWVLGLSTGDSFSISQGTGWSASVDWRNFLVGDYNGDGLDDVMAQHPLGQWWVAASTGTSSISYYAGRWSASAFVDFKIADTDGDGHDDLVGRTATGYWWVGRMRGTNQRMLTTSWGRWSTTYQWVTTVLDINHDNRDDIVGLSAPGGNWGLGRNVWFAAVAQPAFQFTTAGYGPWKGTTLPIFPPG